MAKYKRKSKKLVTHKPTAGADCKRKQHVNLNLKKQRKVTTTTSSPAASSSLVGIQPLLRTRQNIRVVDETKVLADGNSTIPECRHGPCLLFSKECGSNTIHWFGCSVFRSSKRCPFMVKVDQFGAIEPYKSVKQIASLPIEHYGSVKSSFDELSKLGEKIFWCKRCTNYFDFEHSHELAGPYSEWQEPCKLLEPLQDDAGEAQYFFSSESADLLLSVLKNEQPDSVLCIGVPTIFEKLKRMGTHKTFLLDFDDRLSLFYNSFEFARFSMLACHFYLPTSRDHLAKFFRKSKKLICICDPPFGIQVSALMRTIGTLQSYFHAESPNRESRVFNSLLFLPYFIGKHLNDKPFRMVDFQVTYSNHRSYARPGGSVVRIFTDLPNHSFKLPLEKGYHFCDECDRFVAEKNRHCWKCGECTSKDGTPYLHCDTCGRCVRQKYKHCRGCARCHLPGRCNKK